MRCLPGRGLGLRQVRREGQVDAVRCEHKSAATARVADPEPCADKNGQHARGWKQTEKARSEPGRRPFERGAGEREAGEEAEPDGAVSGNVG